MSRIMNLLLLGAFVSFITAENTDGKLSKGKPEMHPNSEENEKGGQELSENDVTKPRSQDGEEEAATSSEVVKVIKGSFDSEVQCPR